MDHEISQRYAECLSLHVEFQKFGKPTEALLDEMDKLWFRMTPEQRARFKSVTTNSVVD